ncbi:MAG: hypothetical protein COA67_07385 [Lutibacter sp.]|nr:MAG: hypothetical protein COA67_07385 [Lutibacter sp.]
MESTKHNFLQWIEISEMVDKGEELNPIDQFIHDNTPAGDDETKFREQLFKAVNYENDEAKTDRNTNTVAAFMEHCKSADFEIPDSMFETYFNA